MWCCSWYSFVFFFIFFCWSFPIYCVLLVCRFFVTVEMGNTRRFEIVFFFLLLLLFLDFRSLLLRGLYISDVFSNFSVWCISWVLLFCRRCVFRRKDWIFWISMNFWSRSGEGDDVDLVGLYRGLGLVVILIYEEVKVKSPPNCAFA